MVCLTVYKALTFDTSILPLKNNKGLSDMTVESNMDGY